jgi:putative oxygen-independent coproporphyrinogen III oxidase
MKTSMANAVTSSIIPMSDSPSRPRSAYIHIPFCAHKCGYCDFASLAGVDHLADRYLAALECELESAVGSPAEVDTIFVGGGTPTRLSATQLRRLTGMLKRWLPLAPGGEWTVEANPGTLDADKVDGLAEEGVNRISLGAQSFQPRLLKALERDHNPDDIPRAVDLVRPRFPHWSLDLIFGAPGSNLEDWLRDLNHAITLSPDHLSCYGLVFEKGTALWKQREAGLVCQVDEEVERQMYEATIDRLDAIGLHQYEISNFAKPGHESRHNLAYWANESYFGVGVGAARYVGGVRSVNTRDLVAYLRRIEAGEPVIGTTEELDPEARARETAILMLRRIQLGLDRRDFLRRTGFDFDEVSGASIRKHLDRGLLEDDGHRLRLTRDGTFLADSVMADLL